MEIDRCAGYLVNHEVMCQLLKFNIVTSKIFKVITAEF